jgi:hypothetical protein
MIHEGLRETDRIGPPHRWQPSGAKLQCGGVITSKLSELIHGR